jgi:COP9 signalosome complex subunit 6
VKDVHKAPVLDLVGWYTLIPVTGPEPYHEAIQAQLSKISSAESTSILLGFHASIALSPSVGGALPLTIYEAYVESSTTGPDVDMAAATFETNSGSSRFSFTPVPYTIETGEAEMISVDFVARGGGNATAVSAPLTTPAVKSTSQKQKSKSQPLSQEAGNKGKKRAAASPELNATKVDESTYLSSEDQELIASLTAKANAVRMLQSRITLITKYLEGLPGEYASSANPQTIRTEPNAQILRSIRALLTRLPLLIPPSTTTNNATGDPTTTTADFDNELLAAQNDIHLVSVLNTLTQSIQSARNLGRKFSIIENSKNGSAKNKSTPFQMPVGGVNLAALAPTPTNVGGGGKMTRSSLLEYMEAQEANDLEMW